MILGSATVEVPLGFPIAQFFPVWSLSAVHHQTERSQSQTNPTTPTTTPTTEAPSLASNHHAESIVATDVILLFSSSFPRLGIDLAECCTIG